MMNTVDALKLLEQCVIENEELNEAIQRCGLVKCHCSVCGKLSICRPDRRNYPCSKACAYKKAGVEKYSWHRGLSDE